MRVSAGRRRGGDGDTDIFMVPGGGRATDNGRTVSPLTLLRDINDDTDISIRCDLSFILISVIKLDFYNFSFSYLI